MEIFPVVDHREDGPWTPSYELGCTCNNCGERHIAIFQKGQKPAPRVEECPSCEVKGALLYHYSSVAREHRAANAAASAGLNQTTPLLLPAGNAKMYERPAEDV